MLQAFWSQPPIRTNTERSKHYTHDDSHTPTHYVFPTPKPDTLTHQFGGAGSVALPGDDDFKSGEGGAYTQGNKGTSN